MTYPGMIAEKRKPPSPPAQPPMPTTEATVFDGNMSEAVVNRFADHPWWADVARLTSATGRIGLLTNTAVTARGMQAAAKSMAAFRALPASQPLRIRRPEIQPPPTLPKSAAR